jgi:hypothetical protein
LHCKKAAAIRGFFARAICLLRLQGRLLRRPLAQARASRATNHKLHAK